MKAIFVGTLTTGFGIKAAIKDDEAEALVISHLANGELAEAVDIQDPARIDKREKLDEFGTTFVVYGKGLGSGFEVFGPFRNDDVARRFAERNEGDEDDWELFDLPEAHSPSPSFR